MTQTPPDRHSGELQAASAEDLIADLRRQIEARDAFIATASHELRNPMTPIIGQVERLLGLVQRAEGPIPRETLLPALEFLQMAAQNYMKRATLLLETSRIAAGKLRLEPSRFDLSAVTLSLAQGYRFYSEKARAPLSLEIMPDLVGTWDRLGVEQIIDNLLSNAIKYGAGRPILLTLKGGADSIELAVHDQGIGISAEDLERLFGRFEQVLGQRHQGGFGVGLWVVRQLVEAMGGTIAVTSRPGEGSSFIVSLPRHGQEQKRESQ